MPSPVDGGGFGHEVGEVSDCFSIVSSSSPQLSALWRMIKSVFYGDVEVIALQDIGWKVEKFSKQKEVLYEKSRLVVENHHTDHFPSHDH
jgi:hypothetical protein